MKKTLTSLTIILLIISLSCSNDDDLNLPPPPPGNSTDCPNVLEKHLLEDVGIIDFLNNLKPNWSPSHDLIAGGDGVVWMVAEGNSLTAGEGRTKIISARFGGFRRDFFNLPTSHIISAEPTISDDVRIRLKETYSGVYGGVYCSIGNKIYRYSNGIDDFEEIIEVDKPIWDFVVSEDGIAIIGVYNGHFFRKVLDGDVLIYPAANVVRDWAALTPLITDHLSYDFYQNNLFFHNGRSDDIYKWSINDDTTSFNNPIFLKKFSSPYPPGTDFEVNSMQGDPNDKMWFAFSCDVDCGSAKNGVYVLNEMTNEFEAVLEYDPGNGFLSQIKSDSKGNLWVSGGDHSLTEIIYETKNMGTTFDFGDKFCEEIHPQNAWMIDFFPLPQKQRLLIMENANEEGNILQTAITKISVE